MNSVISAFKTKKTNSNASSNGGSIEKQNGSSSGSGSHVIITKKKTPAPASINAQDNGYQYLRHIREIETANKLLSPVVVAADDLLESEMLNFRPPAPPSPTTPLSGATAGVDAVDHCTPTTVRLAQETCTDFNMNGKANLLNGDQQQVALDNGNVSLCDSELQQTNGYASPTLLEGDEDEVSEHSTAACTSSSSEHSNSTVVHSPTVVVTTTTTAPTTPAATRTPNQQEQPSPAKSLSLSLSSNSSVLNGTSNSSKPFVSASSSSSSSSCSIALTCEPHSLSTTTLSSLCSIGSCSGSGNETTATTMQPLKVSTLVNGGGVDAADDYEVESGAAANSPTTISNDHDDYVPAFLKTPPVTLPIIMPNSNSGLSTATTPGNSAANTPKHARFTKPRLSLSRFINHSMPSVHGRPNLSVAPYGANGAGAGTGVGANANGVNGTTPSKRISTHQRNMSLDFRSMGIFLPPVSQVTNTRVSQHHRNRSLDSALQRIPEVEVSSPNAESENTFCSPSILGTNMCSKIVTTAASVTAALSTTTAPALTAATTNQQQESAINAITVTAAGYVTPITPTTPVATAAVHQQHHPHHHGHPQKQQQPQQQQPQQSASSVIVEACPTLRARPKSSEASTRAVQDMSGLNGIKGINGNAMSTNSNCSAGNSKKREDLTSLGSDDSGIICGSESDQISLNRIRHSHESLDSSEMDAEEECIDMLETTSMDEEYNLLQSDLCFYPQSTAETDCRTLRPSRKQKQLQQQQQQQPDNNDNPTGESIDDRIRYRVMNMSQAAINMERSTGPNEVEPIIDDNGDVDRVDELDSHADANNVQAEGSDVVDATQTPTNATNININLAATPSATPTQSTPAQTPTPTAETTKNDQVLFKNFFGATKNAIFRTAQSIIENHEKKNAAKQRNDQEAAAAANLTANTVSNAAAQEQVKSPTDISKKKEFFSLLTSNSSKKAAAAAAAAASVSASAANSPAAMPAVDSATPEFKAGDVAHHATNDYSERTLNLRLPGATADDSQPEHISAPAALAKSASINSLNKAKVPGVVKYFISECSLARDAQLLQQDQHQKTEKGSSGLLRFFESPVFNIHFAVHYLFYSKEPGVLSFIGNKIFSFPDQEVDLYIPQLIIMYIQMDELAEVLDPYLTIRCRKSVDFSLKCLWLLEAYNYQVDTLSSSSARKSKLALMKEIFSKKESKMLSKSDVKDGSAVAMLKKTHHRSQSDATVLLTDSHSTHSLTISNRLYQQPPYTTQTLPAYHTTPAKLCLGDLTSGRAFDNGCSCFESVRGQVNGLLGHKTFCSCGAPKTAPQKEFMKALINVGKNLTSLSSKAEKTSALRMFLNLINKNLPARVWLPLYSDIPHHVVRITEEKTAVLNSKDKTPYIIYVEVLEVSDIYSSPVIPKMMTSLRHTKSVEHLEGMPACGSRLQPHISCSRTSSCSSHHGNNSSCRRKKEKLVSESSSTASADANGQHTNGSSSLIGGGACGDVTHNCCAANLLLMGGLQLNEDDVWSQEDDEITAQYLNMRKISERDAISQMSLDSCDSRDQGPPVVFNIGDVRTRHCNNLNCENTKSFSNDPEDPSAAALKEPWHEKEQQIRQSSPYGHLSNWRLLSAIVKCGDDLRQELMATQLLQMFKIIWQEEDVDLWVRPYKIVCLSNDSGLIEPILNTVSLHQIKKNSNKSLRDYFLDEYGPANGESFKLAQKNFVQSCAAYCLISYLLQVKDRHNGNILLHSDGHIIHIDFGFILSISPKNLGFEQSPFKLTPEFVDVMGGTNSEHWRDFNRLLLVGMMSARKHMDRIINFVEIMRSNAQLPCFKNGCSGSVQNLRKRFHMNLTEQEMERKVEQLVQDSLKSLSTKLYDGYQYYTNGIL